MKRTTKSESKRYGQDALLSLLCAGVLAVFITGCAEAPPVTAYEQGYYFPSGNYWRDYDGYYQAYPFSETRAARVTASSMACTFTSRTITALIRICLLRARPRIDLRREMTNASAQA